MTVSGRGLTTNQQNAATGAHATHVLLIEAIFDSGTIRGTTSGVDLPSIGGNSYTAINTLRSIEPLGESIESTEGLRITLDGVDTAIITIAAAEPYRGRALNLYEVWLDAAGAAIGSPVLLFPGLMTALQTTEEGGAATVVVEAEHFEADLRRPREIRFNDADQQQLYAGDKGFEHAERTTELTLVWPSKEVFKR